MFVCIYLYIALHNAMWPWVCIHAYKYTFIYVEMYMMGVFKPWMGRGNFCLRNSLSYSSILSSSIFPWTLDTLAYRTTFCECISILAGPLARGEVASSSCLILDSFLDLFHSNTTAPSASHGLTLSSQEILSTWLYQHPSQTAGGIIIH